MSKIRVLLLTNRDSDNVGDQIIEATVISLIKGVFANLGVAADGFEISSRAAGIISRAYMRTRDEALLESARKSISEADVIVFGGAPLFNYAYQDFYLRTIITLELAQEYNVPVIFSSIGVEPFNAENPKSMRLKEALALPVVRQITTRDDFDSLQKYVEGTDTVIAHVSDPAVFADIVFDKHPVKAPPKPAPSFAYRVKRRLKRIARQVLRRSTPAKVASVPSQPVATAVPARKRVGLVVTRAGIFKANGIEFNEAAQRTFWLEVAALLEERGYDYRFFTTGHFSDEVFLEAMVRESGLPANKAAITINSPEELVAELKACAGVIAYRLHASITSFAYEIPSVGLSWNFKVPYFYESVGHGDRALDHTHWNAAEVVDALEKAMGEGVHKDEAFVMSVYDTLFTGLKAIVAPKSERKPFTYAELQTNLPRYGGTSLALYREKMRRKLRRTYEEYQKHYTYVMDNEARKQSTAQ